MYDPISIDTSATWAYHDGTKHSWQSVQSGTHRLDWSNQPLPFKIYTSLEPLPLPRALPDSERPALEAIGGLGLEQVAGERVPDVAAVARLCLYANGVTRVMRSAAGEMAFRAAGTTGALYHVELYLVCGELPGLAAGVYHYAAHDHALRRLRSGDLRGVLVEATGAEPAIAAAPLIVLSTSTFWRNAWKYQARAYRHSFWDTGTVLANLLAVAAGADLPARVVVGFDDGLTNRLVDVDGRHEATIGLVAVGHTRQAAPPAPRLEPLGLPTQLLSRVEIEYPAILAMHAASSLGSGAEAAVWRGAASRPRQTRPAGSSVEVRPLAPERAQTEPIEAVIRRRGSSRQFLREPISFEQLSTLLEPALQPVPADCGGPLADLYLIVNAVDDLAPGSYVLDPQQRGLERGPLADFRPRGVPLDQLRAGTFRDEAGGLALGQALGADAAVDAYYLADLEPILRRLGNRGYRAAQLTAAIAAGRLWLASYAVRLGATGLTFFDDDVTAFFSPHARGKSALFLLAVGRAARQTSA